MRANTLNDNAPDMPMIHRWWEGRSSEIFWLEVTRRPDIGANLNAPQTNEADDEFWSYSLIKEVKDGDFVFHYDGVAQAIVGRSVATGIVWEDDVIWAARGSSARSANIAPHTRRGWHLGLESYERVPVHVTLDAIREKADVIRSLKASLIEDVGDPLYFPFEIGDRRPIRPMQGYLFKLPSAFLGLFGIEATWRTASVVIRPLLGQKLGDEYRRADEFAALTQRDPFAVDPALVERGVRGHAITQNRLAEQLRSLGIEPRSPRPEEPNFDVAWQANGRVFVAEVKSLTIRNEEKQLRLGLGQVLRYIHQLGCDATAQAVLVVERCPSDSTWCQLCEQLGVILAWPGVLVERLAGQFAITR